jgi:hypothetical protein
MDTCEKIIDSGKLRAVSLSDQKDKTELQFGLEVIRYLLKTIGEYDQLTSLLEEKGEQSDVAEEKKSLYIFCATDENNQFRQWLKYGDAGKGVSIGFRRLELFEKIKADDKYLAYTYPVVYYNDDYTIFNPQSPRIKEFEEDLLAYLHILNSQLENKKDNCCLKCCLKKEVYDVLLVFASLIKKAVYQSEKEWRLLVLTNKTPKTESNKQFIEIEDIKETITGITFGPASSQTDCSRLSGEFSESKWKELFKQ